MNCALKHFLYSSSNIPVFSWMVKSTEQAVSWFVYHCSQLVIRKSLIFSLGCIRASHITILNSFLIYRSPVPYIKKQIQRTSLNKVFCEQNMSTMSKLIWRSEVIPPHVSNVECKLQTIRKSKKTCPHWWLQPCPCGPQPQQLRKLQAALSSKGRL